MDYTEEKNALSRAKVALMARPDSVFFTTLCFSLKHEINDSIPTAATNGTRVMYNPKFLMSLSAEERVFLMLHETMHCAYLHMLRLKERDHRKWNIACDHAINLQLLERKFQMPSMGLADPAYKGMSAEEIYDRLPSTPPPPSESDMTDLLPPDEDGPGSDPGGSGSGQTLESEMQDILVRAAMQSKMAGDKPGTIPGDIEIFLNKLLNPKLPWNRILQKYLQSFNKNDYSFKKPNRRFFPEHHLPSLYSNSLINIAIAVDASGSVADSDFLRFVSEIHSILRMMKPEKIELITFDTEVKSVNTLRNVQELSQVVFTGRGGTLIAPVLEWAEINKPQLLLVFSDGQFRFHQSKHKTPIVWLINNFPRFNPPFGKTIHYDM